MASTTKSLKLPGSLIEIAETMAKRHGYPSWNAYVKGLLRYDAVVQKEHALTLPWAQLSDDQQGRIDDRLLELVRTGKGERGQYLERAITRITESAGVTAEQVKAALVKEVVRSDKLADKLAENS